MNSKNRITPASLHLLKEIAAGRSAVFYMTDKPNGWTQVERAGLAIRDPQNDNYALLTDAGREYLDATVSAQRSTVRV